MFKIFKFKIENVKSINKFRYTYKCNGNKNLLFAL